MNECLIWTSLSDKAAVGEPLTAAERLFLRSHRSGCSSCGAEAALWDDLENVLEEPERLNRPCRQIEPPVEGRLPRFASARAWRRRPVLVTVAIVAAAAAASVALWLRPSARSEANLPGALTAVRRVPVVPPATAPSAGARLALAAGETFVNRRPAIAGDRLGVGAVVSVGVGQACLLLPPGVSVCLDPDTELSIATLEAGQRRLRLHRGHALAHLDSQPGGSTFGFETAAGSVVAKGTVFSLRTDGATVTLRVHEGVVVNHQGSETSAYMAPSTARLSHEPATSRATDEAASDSRLVELARFFSDSAQGTLAVTAVPGSNVALDDFYLGMTPLSVLVQPGDYRMEVSRAGFAPIVERLKLAPGARVARDYEATADFRPAGGREAAKSAPVAAAPTAAELLERARELRVRGRYQEANNAYQRLLQEHSASPEARVALVSRGELQLSQLADAAAALRSFDAYLRAGGALRQEASYGRIRALRRLGRVNDAQAATEAFLSAYPRSAQAATLRKGIP